MGEPVFDAQLAALQALGPVRTRTAAELRAALSGLFSAQLAVDGAVSVEAALSAALLDRAYFPSPQVEKAFADAYPDLAATTPLPDHLDRLADEGPEHLDGLLWSLRGKLFEEKLPELLAERFPGSTWALSQSATEAGWDLTGHLADGTVTFVQAKARAASAASEVIERMDAEDAPQFFALTHELVEKVLEMRPDLAERVLDLDVSTLELDEQVDAVFETLADHLHFAVPEVLTDALPYVGEIVLGIRLLLDVAQNEKMLVDMPRGDKNRLHMVRAGALLVRFGVSTVCTTIGGTAGGAVGTAIAPGVGSAVGGVVGSVAGGITAGAVNKSVQPRLVEFGLAAAGVSREDLFYFQHRATIDAVGAALRAQADGLSPA